METYFNKTRNAERFLSLEEFHILKKKEKKKPKVCRTETDGHYIKMDMNYQNSPRKTKYLKLVLFSNFESEKFSEILRRFLYYLL